MNSVGTRIDCRLAQVRGSYRFPPTRSRLYQRRQQEPLPSRSRRTAAAAAMRENPDDHEPNAVHARPAGKKSYMGCPLPRCDSVGRLAAAFRRCRLAWKGETRRVSTMSGSARPAERPLMARIRRQVGDDLDRFPPATVTGLNGRNAPNDRPIRIGRRRPCEGQACRRHRRRVDRVPGRKGDVRPGMSSPGPREAINHHETLMPRPLGG